MNGNIDDILMIKVLKLQRLYQRSNTVIIFIMDFKQSEGGGRSYLYHILSENTC